MLVGEIRAQRRATAPPARHRDGRRRHLDRRAGGPAGRPARRLRPVRQARTGRPRDGRPAVAAAAARRTSRRPSRGRPGSRLRQPLRDTLGAADRPGAKPAPPRTGATTMSTEATPRLKITYATLRNDNDELHAQFEAGLAQGPDDARRAATATSSAAPSATARHVREAHARSTARSWARSRRARGRTSRTRSPRPARPSRPGRRRPWQERVAILRRVADVISERQMEFARAARDRGRQEPARGARRRRGDGRPHPLVVRHDGANDGFDHPMGNLGDATVHTRSVLKPYGVWGVISPFNFPFALSRRAVRRRARRRQHGRLQAVLGRAAVGRAACTQAMRDAGVPDGVFNMVMGPGETVGAELQENDGVDGIIFTGSFEVGFELYKNFAKRYPEAGHRRDGRQEPGDRDAPRRPRRGRRGRHARRVRLLAARSARPTAGSTSSGRSTTSSSSCSSRRPRRSRSATRLDRQNWLGPVINQRAVARYEQAVVGGAHGRPAASIGGERLTERRPRHGLLRRADRRRRPARPTTACSATSCSCRSPRSRRSTRSTRRSACPTTRTSG